MEILDTEIPEIKIIMADRFGDRRGFFSETYNKHALAERGIDHEFVQDNHSLSREIGVVRGLHFQTPPFAQDKLIRVVCGAIFDVAVDIRQGSPTFGRHVSGVLSKEAWNQMLIPAGFAHGFCTLETNTEVIYKVSNYYAPDHDHGIRWNDPELAISWPFSGNQAIISDKDRSLPCLSEFDPPFVYRRESDGVGS